MLRSAKMIGFVLTRNTAQARRFYEGVLGFRFQKEDGFALVMETDDNMIRISPVKEFTPAGHTVMGWEVRDIQAIARELHGRGVRFERYPFTEAAQDTIGVWASPSGDNVAWFKDPDGNLLSISQHLGR
jgi:catechol 2,3-dioxygenase-like lactoylglutathione lyase family enzyme